MEISGEVLRASIQNFQSNTEPQPAVLQFLVLGHSFNQVVFLNS